MAAKKKEAARSSLSIVSGSITINGETREISGVNYSRIENEDGTVVETGRPVGLPEGASIGEAMAQAFAAFGEAVAERDLGEKARNRKRRKGKR